MIKAIIFDYGGVLAEEGFVKGLGAIAERNHLDPTGFFRTAADLIYETGYVTGNSEETLYLNRLREQTGIRESNNDIRHEILSRFILRPDVLNYVTELRAAGFITAILSDQTDWIDELNNNNPFFHHFDHVYNSYKIGKGKRDISVFGDICRNMALRPEETIFVDDNPDNISRASEAGLNAILYTGLEDLKREIQSILRRER